MGWFFGFKLHLVTNHFGQIITFRISPGNVDDRAVVPKMTKNIFGKIFADKGNISQELFEKLFHKGLKIVTSMRANMRPRLMEYQESQDLGERSLIESIFNVLKNSCRIEHSRHRNPINFCVNVISALCAYIFKTTIFQTQVQHGIA